MEEINWIKIFELLIPIILVFLAGLIALYQMRQNVKLQARLKWKEEFRQKVDVYINTMLMLYTHSLKNKKPTGETEIFNEYEKLNREALIHWGNIYMMLDQNSEENEKFTKLHKDNIRTLREIQNQKNNVKATDFNIAETHILAKKIYDNHKL